MPLGGLVGGVLGEAIGIRDTLVVAACGACLAFLWMFASPMRMMRELPVPSGNR